MPVWVARSVVLAIHEAQIAEHGGLPGLRDAHALDSALAKPRHVDDYSEASLFDLGAAYAFGLARNHPFNDGNKRVSAVVTELFLELNGASLLADDADLVATWLAIAGGEMAEPAISDWLRANSRLGSDRT